MDLTEHSVLPPTLLTVTLIDPDNMELGVEIVGPGIDPGDSGEVIGTGHRGLGDRDGIGDVRVWINIWSHCRNRHQPSYCTCIKMRIKADILGNQQNGFL